MIEELVEDSVIEDIKRLEIATYEMRQDPKDWYKEFQAYVIRKDLFQEEYLIRKLEEQWVKK